MKRIVWMIVLTGAVAFNACSKKGETSKTTTKEETVAVYPIEIRPGALTGAEVTADSATTSDGDGSIRVTATSPISAKVYETRNIDVEKAKLTYRARLRTEDVKGRVYIELQCSVPGKADTYARSLQTPVTGTTEWTSQETTLSLGPGENPENIQLNVVIEGTGTVWVDEVQLTSGPPGDS